MNGEPASIYNRVFARNIFVLSIHQHNCVNHDQRVAASLMGVRSQVINFLSSNKMTTGERLAKRLSKINF